MTATSAMGSQHFVTSIFLCDVVLQHRRFAPFSCFSCSIVAPLRSSHSNDTASPLHRVFGQAFATWFKSNFPYYYGSCCSTESDFLGYTLPAADERRNNDSSRREIYYCCECGEARGENVRGWAKVDEGPRKALLQENRPPNAPPLFLTAARTSDFLYSSLRPRRPGFERYNSPLGILKSRRGRCGEYSLLCYRFLGLLGLDVRWVVDWGDHVWVEVWR